MRNRLAIVMILLLVAPSLSVAQENEATDTAPRFLVDAQIVEVQNGELLLVAARLYFDTLQTSYHVVSQLEGQALTRREQEVSMLQSEVVRYALKRLEFRTVDGNRLPAEDVRARLDEHAAILLLPEGATLHPAIAATLKPETIIANKVGGSSPRKLVTRPKS